MNYQHSNVCKFAITKGQNGDTFVVVVVKNVIPGEFTSQMFLG